MPNNDSCVDLCILLSFLCGQRLLTTQTQVYAEDLKFVAALCTAAEAAGRTQPLPVHIAVSTGAVSPHTFILFSYLHPHGSYAPTFNQSLNALHALGCHITAEGRASLGQIWTPIKLGPHLPTLGCVNSSMHGFIHVTVILKFQVREGFRASISHGPSDGPEMSRSTSQRNA